MGELSVLSSIKNNINNSITSENAFKVIDYNAAVVHNYISDHEFGSRIGRRSSIPTASFELFQNASVSQPSSNTGMVVVSTSSNDSSSGSGAQRLTLKYFNQAWELKTEVITMNGLTNVNTVNSDIYRIDSLTVSRVGSGGVAAGTITFKSSNGLTTYAQIDADTNLFERALHYVKTGYRSMITDIELGCSTNGGVIFRLILSEEDSDGNLVSLAHLSIELANNTAAFNQSLPVTVNNPNGKRIAIGFAIKGINANQRATGSFRFIDSLI